MKVINKPTLKGISKKSAGNLASLINSSYCAMIMLEHNKVNHDKGSIDFDTYHRKTEMAFKMHDDAIREINRLLGTDLVTYRKDHEDYFVN